MIRLSSKSLSATTKRELVRQQQIIDKQPDFASQAAKAQTRWDGKEGSKTGKAAFAEIRLILQDITVSTQACSYCEYSEGEDIDHVYPKSWFPERTFSWDNYLLACKSCNTSFKRAEFAVFNPASSNKLLHLKRNITTGKPPTTAGLLLNPRVEDPLAYLEIDFFSGAIFRAKSKLSLRKRQRADYTCELLKLNVRAELIKARSKARRDYTSLLQEYVAVKKATTLAKLKKAVTEPNIVVTTLSFIVQQTALLDSLKNALLTNPHPSVWHEMKRQHQNLPQAAILFQDAPEALSW